MSWRHVTDFCRQSQTALRFADWLGRGRGRLRFLDRVSTLPPARKPDLREWSRHDLSAIWIGHATVLLRVGGRTILTDPVFSNRVGIGLGLCTAGPLRHVAPALTIRELPPIDLILISHAHFDHLDRPSLDRLPKHIPVIAPHNTADLIRDLGFRGVAELRWGESATLDSLKITSQPVAHWGARTLYDQHRGFSAFLIESPRRRILYGGDTAFGEHFRALGKVDLAILGIGGYNPYIAAHASPEQAWHMANHVRADYVLPIHHSTFSLSHEPIDEPIQRLVAAASGDRGRVIIHEVGGQWGI